LNSVAFSPDGSRLVTSSRDGTARVWDLRGGSQTAVLRGHENVVWSAEYDPSGQRIVTASAGWHGPNLGRGFRAAAFRLARSLPRRRSSIIQPEWAERGHDIARPHGEALGFGNRPLARRPRGTFRSGVRRKVS